MMGFADMLALGGMAFAVVRVLSAVPWLARWRDQPWWLPVGMLLALIPFDGLSLAGFLRGLLGDLSLASLLLLALGLWPDEIVRNRQRSSILYGVLLLGLCLYPAALGLGMFDPYRLGFGDLTMLSGLLAVALLTALRGYGLAAVWLSLAVLGWALRAGESTNLWNYLIDPWVCIYALAVLLRRTLRH